MTTITRRLRLYFSMVRYGRAHHRDFAKEHFAFFQTMEERLRDFGIESLEGLRVLDVGCGKTYWLTLLLHSRGVRVTGIDTEFVHENRGAAKYVRILRDNGAERALRTLVWDVFYAPSFYRELAQQCPFPLCFEDLDLRKVSADTLDLETSAFDLAVSHEVFEHIEDVPGAVRALRRVLKPDGLTYIYIHNFASISGGHHIAWKYPDSEPSETVSPWDHLREKHFPDIPSWINRLREREYRAIFEEEFDIVDWIPTVREGEGLLTSEIREELADYTEAELLTKGFIVIGRPKLQANAGKGERSDSQQVRDE